MKRFIFIIIFTLFVSVANFAAPAKGSSKANVDLSIQAEEYIATKTRIVKLKSAKADEVAVVIRQALSKYGNIQINEERNFVIITDIPEMINDLTELARALDLKNFKSADGVKTEVIYLNYVHPDTIKEYIAHKISPQGVLKTSSQLNSILITDVPSRIEEIKEIIKKVDIPVKQVEVEAKIIEINVGDARNLGIDWNAILTSNASNIISNITPFDERYSSTDTKTEDKTLTPSTNTFENKQNKIDSTEKNSEYFLRLNLSVDKLSDLINLLIQENNGKVLSTPRIVTENNKPASFFSGDKIPYQNQNRYSSIYKDKRQVYDKTYDDIRQSYNVVDREYFAVSGVSLYINPHINADNSISMYIETDVDSLSGYSPQDQPIIYSRSTNTHITVNNNETFIIGGLRKQYEVKGVKRFPVLGYIPVLGLLFTKEVSSVGYNEIIIFITPRVLLEPQNIDEKAQEKLKIFDKDEKKKK